MAVHACGAQDRVHVIHEEGMIDRRGEFDVPKVAGTLKVVQATCPTSAQTIRAIATCTGRRGDIQVLGGTGPEAEIVEATGVGIVEMVEDDGVHDLLHGDAPDVGRAQEREGHRGHRTRDRVRSVHHTHCKNRARRSCTATVALPPTTRILPFLLLRVDFRTRYPIRWQHSLTRSFKSFLTANPRASSMRAELVVC